jgi:hypothetical protein
VVEDEAVESLRLYQIALEQSLGVAAVATMTGLTLRQCEH